MDYIRYSKKRFKTVRLRKKQLNILIQEHRRLNKYSLSNGPIIDYKRKTAREQIKELVGYLIVKNKIEESIQREYENFYRKKNEILKILDIR